MRRVYCRPGPPSEVVSHPKAGDSEHAVGTRRASWFRQALDHPARYVPLLVEEFGQRLPLQAAASTTARIDR